MTGLTRDRELWLAPGETMAHAEIPIQWCKRGTDHPLAAGDVGEKQRELIQMGGRQPWPGLIGYWDTDGFFAVMDGNHLYAALIHEGHTIAHVSWRAQTGKGEAVTW